MTPTMPLPAPTRSLSLGMYEKSWVNELMLRSDGTVAGDAVAVPPPPQAIATIPTTPSVGISLANLIWFFLLCKCYLSPSSRRSRGESAPANRPYSEAWGHAPAAQSIAHPPKFVKSAMVRPTQFVQTLDKPPWVPMIRVRGYAEER